MSLVPHQDREGILNALGYNPRDPKVQALTLVAQRYGLDLILKQVFLIQGTVYVSHAGLLSLAHRSGDLDGIEVEVTEDDKKWVATARIYRKSMSRPFVYTDECFKNEAKVSDKRKRAITRAERNALRRAFDVGVDIWEDDRPEPPIVLSPSRPALPGGGPQADSSGLAVSRAEPQPEPPPGAPSGAPALDPGPSVVVRCREMGLDDDQRHELIAWVTKDRTTSTKEISAKEAAAVHRLLHDLKTSGEAPWKGSRRETPTGSSQPSGESPAPTDTSSRGSQLDESAEGAEPSSS